MRSLAGSLADGVLTDAILIPHRPPIPPTNSGGFRGFHRFQLKPPFRSLIVLTYSLILVSLNDIAPR